MSSSESGEFESADEDFEEQQKAKKNQSSKSSKVDNEKNVKDLNAGTRRPKIDTSHDHCGLVDNKNNAMSLKEVKEGVDKEKEDKYIEEPIKSPLDEYAIPPQIVYCWQPGIDNETAYNNFVEMKKKMELERVAEYKEDLNTEMDKSKVDASHDNCDKVENKNNTKSVKENKEKEDEYTEEPTKSPLDEYAVPPPMEYCWEPDIDNDTAYNHFVEMKKQMELEKAAKKPENIHNICDKDEKSENNKEKKIFEETESNRSVAVDDRVNVESDSNKEAGNNDGWDDFGDWDDDYTSSTVKKKVNVDYVFPILEEISSGENKTQNEKGIFENLSKLVGGPKTSTYDSFPVVNEISPTRKKISHEELNFDEKKETSMEKTINKEEEKGSSSWGWKPWGGVVSLISTATEGVTKVGQSLSTVIESGIGVPDPEEMARLQKKNREKCACEEKNENTEEKLLPTFGNIVSGVTSIGSRVITGGLDTLEGIGKKTMTILQENDPLLLNKRKMLGLEGEKPVLSQILREAKNKSEEAEKNMKQMQKHQYKKQLHFETLFDHYHGLVHLEALEMLSKQSSIRLQSVMEPLTGKALDEIKETLDEVKEFCDLGDLENLDFTEKPYSVDDLSQKFSVAVEDLGIKTDFSEIFKTWSDILEWLNSEKLYSAQEIYDKSLRSLAEATALGVHKMHKIAELLLIKDHHSTANEADSIVQLTGTICWHLHGIANSFATKLNNYESNEEISSMITTIFMEQSNGTSCIKNVFQLFIPILQIGAV